MFNSNIKISLRSKLMLMSISVLIIPYIGFEVIRQTETYLRSTLESTVKKDSQVVASTLNNKPRLLYHFKNRGYRKFCMNRPDKHYTKLSKTEKELGGIPNSSEAVKQAHASAIESYIENNIGFKNDLEMGDMVFTRTLEDWARFDISNRTKFDASISSGLAIMATQKHLYLPDKKLSKIKINFARYSNKGKYSEIIR